jgi:hypothetical protein
MTRLVWGMEWSGVFLLALEVSGSLPHLFPTCILGNGTAVL